MCFDGFIVYTTTYDFKRNLSFANGFLLMPPGSCFGGTRLRLFGRKDEVTDFSAALRPLLCATCLPWALDANTDDRFSASSLSGNDPLA